MIQRTGLVRRIQRSLRNNPVTALYGPRQCGKTIAARQIAAAARAEYFDLEDPVSARRLSAPMTALRPLRGLIVIDEVQRQRELFPVLITGRYATPRRLPGRWQKATPRSKGTWTS